MLLVVVNAWPLTDSTPKPLLHVQGKPLIVHHLERLRDAGITQVVVNTSWLAEKIHTALGDGSRWGVHVNFSYEGPEPLETGGGISVKAMSLLGREPFMVVNGDISTDFPFENLKHKLKHDDLTTWSWCPIRSIIPPGDSTCRR